MRAELPALVTCQQLQQQLDVTQAAAYRLMRQLGTIRFPRTTGPAQCSHGVPGPVMRQEQPCCERTASRWLGWRPAMCWG